MVYTEHDGERAFIAAILDQAFSDAISREKANDPLGARRFIDEKDFVFACYCELLGFDPTYVAEKMQRRIRTFELKPVKWFRP